MMERGFPAETVDEYLAAVPDEQRDALATVRERLVAAIPDVEQVMSYQVPTFRYRGRALLGLSAAKDHCSLHLMSPPLAKALGSELTEGKLSGATLHFANDAPLGEATVRLIVDRRIAEVTR
ncbi:MAG: iron chaperone [Aeromicrobium sp.]